MIYIWIKCMDPEKKIWLPLPPKKTKFFCKYLFLISVFCFYFCIFWAVLFFCFSFVFFFLAAAFFVFFFSVFVFSFFPFNFLFFADCFLLLVLVCFPFLVFFCFSVFVCASFCAFFGWNQTCWFLRTSPVLVKIKCLDLRCVKHIGLIDKPLSHHDFLRCFVTVVLRNFPRWHRDGLRQRQDRGCLSLKQLGSWRQKHGMEEEIPVSNLKVSIMFNFHLLLNFNFLEGVCPPHS